MKVNESRYSVTPMRVRNFRTDAARFSSQLRADEPATENSLGRSAARQVNAILEQEAALDAAMEHSLNGESMDQREMLELQATVYSYSQRVEIATRVIDRGASAVKQLLNTQL